MGWRQRLQINLWVPPGAKKNWLDIFYPDFADGIFYPTIKYEETASINNHQAQEFRDKVEMMLWYQKFFFWFSLALGITLLVVGVVLVAVGGRCLWKIKRQKTGYDRFLTASRQHRDLTINTPQDHNTLHLPRQQHHRPQLPRRDGGVYSATERTISSGELYLSD